MSDDERLEQLVAKVVDLQPDGSVRLKAYCPFCWNGSPNAVKAFRIDPHKGFYKCFACGKAGDADTWRKEMEARG